MSDDVQIGPPMACPTPPEPGKWSWRIQPSSGNRFLVAPNGGLAATIYANLTWFVWDAVGNGRQNDLGKDLADAKWCAAFAAKVLWYESGWIDPVAPAAIRKGSRVRAFIKGCDMGEHVVVDVYPETAEALVCSVPSPDKTPKWEHAPVGVYSLADLTLLPPVDLPTLEDDDEDDDAEG